ncbi:MAG: glycosyltransferase [Lachnospiraceae bacterium]|jgi:glycosyltransferase involved in cell wall biosynthesis|nr:glycosyltransferase [Lachnospiraceae bacterium]
MTATPLISVIIPVYNTQRFLRDCLDSVCAQTYKNLEIFLIDDGSTDGSGRICDDYAGRDKRFRAIHLAENHGVSHARNMGLKQAGGSLIGFVDADDWLEKNLFESLYRSLTENQADISSCAVRLVHHPHTNTWRYGAGRVVSGEAAISLMMRKQYFCRGVYGKLFTRSVLGNCRFAENIHCGEDVLFLYKVFGRASRVIYTPELLYHYIYRDASLFHGTFHKGQYTELLVYEFLYREFSINHRELLPETQQILLGINMRLAFKVAESKDMGRRQKYAWLRRFHSNIRRFMSREALALFEYKKNVAEVILLYGSAEIFWVVLVLYKGVKRLL